MSWARDLLRGLLDRDGGGSRPRRPAPAVRPAGLARCRPALGTYIKISAAPSPARAPGAPELSEEALFDATRFAFAEVERLEGLLSYFDPESELSRLHRIAHLRPVVVSPEMAEILAFARRLSRETDGAFDLTTASVLVERGLLPDLGWGDVGPGASWRDVTLEGPVEARQASGARVRFARPLLLDLGGIAKGYVVDRALAVLASLCPGIDAVVDAGGDLRRSVWRGRRVEVRTPPGGGGPPLVPVEMRAAAVATSAPYFSEGGSRTICPRTRRPLADARSVSVFAPTCMEADALTKVAFQLPPDHPCWSRPGVSVLVVDAEGRQECWGAASDPESAAAARVVEAT